MTTHHSWLMKPRAIVVMKPRIIVVNVFSN